MAVPYLDLRAQYAGIRDDIEGAVLRVLRSTRYVLGEEVAAFECEFAHFCDSGYGVATNSGTSALHLALLAAGVGPGDEVITVSNTFVATVAAIEYAGARAVFVDIDRKTLTMDPALLEAQITSETKAILPVHLHGHPSDLNPILELAQRHNLKVIEDAAQAHDAAYRGRRIGGIGDLTCFSFYPGKNLGAIGEGGVVLTNSEHHAALMRQLRDWGQTTKHDHRLRGFNYRMDAIQAAALRVKLKHLRSWTDARRSVAGRYSELLRDLPVEIPAEAPYARHVYHVYAIRTPGRDELQRGLSARDIGTGIHYPTPVHLQPAYADCAFRAGDLPVTEEVAVQLLSLPMYAELGEPQIREVCNAIEELVNG